MNVALSPLVASIPVNPLRALFPLAARPGMLNLASGHPSHDAYDHQGLELAVKAAARDFSAWTYGPSAGDPDLVAELASLSGPVPEGCRMIVTSGAQQAVDVALRSVAEPGSSVLVPEPVYPAILSLCAAAGVRPVRYTITGDEALEDLEKALATNDIRAMYALPTFSNPTGETWSLAQRRRVLALCGDAGVAIVEDDPYRLIHFDTPPPSLFELARGTSAPVVVHAGSLSKVVAPGLRLGWALAPVELAAAMQDARQASDLQPNALAQRVAVHYLRLERMAAHLERVRALYRDRKTVLAAAVKAAGFDVPETGGGMFLFPRLPAGARAEAVFDRAVENDVLFAPGPAFGLPDAGVGLGDRLRLCFAGMDAATLAEAATRLVRAVDEAR